MAVAQQEARAEMTLNPSKLSPITAALLKDFYAQMLLIRRFEERASQLYGMGQIGGFCHLYIGQEAIVVGAQSVVEPQDTIVTAYRDHGHMLVCGMDPKGVMAELLGRQDGYSKGKGGSMHMFSREKNFFGGHGIVGAQVPIGTGLAFAHHYREDSGVCMTYMGDGAANQGQVYESFNMAALWKLPVVYIIENNKYGMGTSVERAAAGKALYHRGEPYGIPGKKINGMDVVAVREAMYEALQYARSGKGPTLIEMETYRYRGHSMSDPAKYRSKEEVEEVRQHHDPIEHVQQLLLKEYKVPGEDLVAIEKDIKNIVLGSVSFAQASPHPDPAELYTDVFIE